MSFTTSTALLTDHYELTMLQAALRSGAAHRKSVFEAFARKLPNGRRYGVVGGTGRVLEALENFRFGDEELKFLTDNRILDKETLSYLESYSFSGDIYGYEEGEIYFPNSPLLIVEGTFAETCIIETLLLSIMNHDSAIASAASRMSVAAGTRPCFEMGSRRTHEEAAVAAARVSIIAGFSATSNLEAGRRYGVKTMGTAAHSFTMLHDTEEAAFRAQVASLGAGTSLLVDTYDVEEGIRTAVKVAGPELGAIRLDSGDLVAQAGMARDLLDSLGNDRTGIVVTSDLDEYAIAALASAPVNSYGVGTRLVTGSGAPTAQMVYKLVAREDSSGDMVSVAKKASGKATVGGRKYALRRKDERGIATAEVIGVGHAPESDHDDRPLLTQLVAQGAVDPTATGAAGVAKAAARYKSSIAELPVSYTRLTEGEPVIPTLYED
jgi:nicotinate phosphoribosyltransferase